MTILFKNSTTKHLQLTISADVLSEKIQQIFNKHHSEFNGKFTSEDEFAAQDKWTYIKWYVPNFKRQTAYLQGKILKSNSGSLLTVSSAPNPFLSFVSILTIVIGLFLLLFSLNQSNNESSIFFGIIIFVLGLVSYLIGLYLRTRLFANFRKSLDIQNIPFNIL